MSLVLLITDVVFVLINYYADLNTLKAETRNWAAQVEKIFTISLDAQALAMQQLASFIASDSGIQTLLKAGRDAVTREGGGPGGPDAARLRTALLETIQPSWKTINSGYDVHQLHFHLIEENVSFLRVHLPRHYGDPMSRVRHMIRDAARTGLPARGFETGRTNSGIRGAVPVVYRNKEVLGTLEAVTSFSRLLDTLKTELESELCILLTRDHATGAMWPQALAQKYPPDKQAGPYLIKAGTQEGIKPFLLRPDIQELLAQGGPAFFRGKTPLQTTAFAIRDYHSAKNPNLPPSGKVLVWKDAANRYQAFRQGVVHNIIYAVLALVLLESLLFLAWFVSKNKFKAAIARKTEEVKAGYTQMLALAQELPLGILMVNPKTGEVLDANVHLSRMTGQPVKTIIGQPYAELVRSDTSAESLEETGEAWMTNSRGEAFPVLRTEITTFLRGAPVLIAALTDMTERKLAEASQIRKEKLESVLALAGAVCHEINQPLMVISGHTELLLEETPESSDFHVQVRVIKEHADQLAKITDQLMNITEYQTREYLDGQILDIDKSSSIKTAEERSTREKEE